MHNSVRWAALLALAGALACGDDVQEVPDTGVIADGGSRTADAAPTRDATPSADATPNADAAPNADATPSADATPNADAAPNADASPSPDALESADTGATLDTGPAPDAGLGLPPDPSAVAPPLDRSVASNVADVASFLWSGPNPIQTGAAPGSIDPRRVVVLRGRALERGGRVLPGVAISIDRHPELGRTLTRLDGRFDLGANGGGTLRVRYEKAGYLPADRSVTTPWQGFVTLGDVVLVPLDPEVTTVQLGPAAPAQLARGSTVTDRDGTRRSTLIVPAGTSASLVMPDGGVTPASTLHLRATEYTVGDDGPKSMPAELPSTSAYTYAVELSADEAIAAGAHTVSFDRPIVHYVENFLSFPVGSAVPTGYYDRLRSGWIPSANGRVIRVLSIGVDGLAVLDLDGDGSADPPASLTALGVTGEERRLLASAYRAGQSLWRVPIPHLTPWDHNWPYAPPSDAVAPSTRRPRCTGGCEEDKYCQLEGSIIELDNQTLGESVPIAGTDLRLSYRSDRTPARTPGMSIPLAGANVPASLQRADVVIEVAGRRFEQSYTTLSPNQEHAFTWDGTDAYGRQLQGSQTARVLLSYSYPAAYTQPRDFAQSFGRFGDARIQRSVARSEISLSRDHLVTIASRGPWDARAQALGGWTLDVHHAYDPVGRVLYLGDGSRRSGRDGVRSLRTVAPSGAWRGSAKGIAAAPDGSVYVIAGSQVHRVGLDGSITLVAGTGTRGFSGDGGPATAAELDSPLALALGPDGSLYIGDWDNNRVRRVDPAGVITTVAGDGTDAFSGDGGPATAAGLTVESLAVGADFTLYIGDSGNSRIRAVGPDGIITTVGGDGTDGYAGDGGPAPLAHIGVPHVMAVGPDGSVYFSDTLSQLGTRIRRITPDGVITTAAGNGARLQAGDGGPAPLGSLNWIQALAVGPDGTIYASDFGDRYLIRTVEPDGTLSTLIDTSFDLAEGLAVAPDGSLLVAKERQLQRLAPPLPGFSGSEIAIASDDAGEIHRFDARGRHLSTLHAISGALLRDFGYDSGGRLIEIRDGSGNTTRIERNASGAPTAIIGPHGHRTELGLDANGWLSRVTDPAGSLTVLTHSQDGLLTSMTDAGGGLHQYTYNASGHLSRDTDPAGGFKQLTRTSTADGFEVTVTTAANQTSRRRVVALPNRQHRETMTFADGRETISTTSGNGDTTTRFSDGMSAETSFAPDPRFGLESPFLSRLLVRTPGGTSSLHTRSRRVTLARPDPFSLIALTDTEVVNGRSGTLAYAGASRTATLTSPAGRRLISTADPTGRLTGLRAGTLEPLALAYDARGRLETLSHGRGAAARSVVRSYGNDGLLSSITGPLNHTLGFVRDARGRVIEQRLSGGGTILLSRDPMGRLLSVTTPSGAGHAFEHSPAGLPLAYTAPSVGGAPGARTTYSFDLDRRLLSVGRPDGRTIAVTRDGAGRPASLTIARGAYGYSYDGAGRVSSITAPGGGAVAMTYDGTLVTGLRWTGEVAGQVDLTYDRDHNVASVRAAGGGAIAYTTDGDGLTSQAGALAIVRGAIPGTGQVTGTSLLRVTDTLDYDGFGALATQTTRHDANTLYSVAYTRDALGRITERRETIAGITTLYGYAYDADGRLARADRDGATLRTYSYDANGNRLSDGTTTAAFDERDRLVRLGTATYTWDAAGDLDSRTDGAAVTSFEYDELGALLEVSLASGTRIAYVIDAAGRRIGKKRDGALERGFLYAIPGVLGPAAELDPTGAVVSQFIYATRRNVPDYMLRGGGSYRLVTDHVGSVRLVVNAATGQVAQRIDYGPFGEVTADTNPGFQPFGFAGGLYDPDTGLVRFGARDYDASAGRWLTPDPLRFRGGDFNLYRYAGGDPVNTVDPDGRFIPLAIVAVAVAGWAITTIAKSINYNEGLELAEIEAQVADEALERVINGEAEMRPEDFQHIYNSRNAARVGCTTQAAQLATFVPGSTFTGTPVSSGADAVITLGADAAFTAATQ